MCSKDIFSTLGLWVELPQNLGFDFSVSVVIVLLLLSGAPLSLLSAAPSPRC